MLPEAAHINLNRVFRNTIIQRIEPVSQLVFREYLLWRVEEYLQKAKLSRTKGPASMPCPLRMCQRFCDARSPRWILPKTLKSWQKTIRFSLTALP